MFPATPNGRTDSHSHTAHPLCGMVVNVKWIHFIFFVKIINSWNEDPSTRFTSMNHFGITEVESVLGFWSHNFVLELTTICGLINKSGSVSITFHFAYRFEIFSIEFSRKFLFYSWGNWNFHGNRFFFRNQKSWITWNRLNSTSKSGKKPPRFFF